MRSSCFELSACAPGPCTGVSRQDCDVARRVVVAQAAFFQLPLSYRGQGRAAGAHVNVQKTRDQTITNGESGGGGRVLTRTFECAVSSQRAQRYSRLVRRHAQIRNFDVR